MELIAYKAGDRFADKLIQGWTGHEYSHCELRINNRAYSSSMMDGGVRDKFIDTSNGKWDVLPLTKFSELYALNFYARTRGLKYSVTDLILNQILNSKFTDSTRMFCSEWCAEALGIPDGRLYNPGTLVKLVKYIENMP